MARLWEGAKYTLTNNKYKTGLNSILQPSIKVLIKSSYILEDMKQVPLLLQFIVIQSPYSLKHGFNESHVSLLCVSLNPGFSSKLFSYDAWHDIQLCFRFQIWQAWNKTRLWMCEVYTGFLNSASRCLNKS